MTKYTLRWGADDYYVKSEFGHPYETKCIFVAKLFDSVEDALKAASDLNDKYCDFSVVRIETTDVVVDLDAWKKSAYEEELAELKKKYEQ